MFRNRRFHNYRLDPFTNPGKALAHGNNTRRFREPAKPDGVGVRLHYDGREKANDITLIDELDANITAVVQRQERGRNTMGIDGFTRDRDFSSDPGANGIVTVPDLQLYAKGAAPRVGGRRDIADVAM